MSVRQLALRIGGTRGTGPLIAQRIAGAGHCDLHVYLGVGHLLTRNLANQESDVDPDPVAREDGSAKQVEFLRSLWLR